MMIRRAEERDVKELLEIYNYEVMNGTATFDLHPRTMDDWLKWFQSHLSDRHPLLVAEADGDVAGYAGLSPYRDKEAYITTAELSVYVGAVYRGRGVAKALMKAVIEEAGKRGKIHTVVSVITSGNAASLALHKEFGFTYCGTMREVGIKFGRFLDIEYYQLII